jgi:Asp/Glu/hydantoin racemase
MGSRLRGDDGAGDSGVLLRHIRFNYIRNDRTMAMRIWHQSFTVLQDLPAYNDALAAHFKKMARPDTEIVMHGMAEGTYPTNYPGTDICFDVIQRLHGPQFLMAGIAAEEAGFDAYAISSIPDIMLRETRASLNIPVVGYGESAMLFACTLGEKFGILNFIEGMAGQLADNALRYGLGSRFVAARQVGFTFADVLKGYSHPAELIERFKTAARKMIADGADVIIPGEAPLCVLLANNGVNRVDDVPVMDSLAAWIKMAESLVDLRRSSGLSPSRRGYFQAMPPRARLKELLAFYGQARLAPKS